MKTMKILAILILAGCTLLAACKFKQQAEARIKGEGGELILKVEVTAGASFKTSGRISESQCQGTQFGREITVAACDIPARITRREQSGNTSSTVTRDTVVRLEYKIACIPGTTWEVDCSDPVIMQVPLDWHVSKAVFAGKMQRGNLVVQEGLIAANYSGTPYRAEPGHKVVLLGFPYGTPDDDYAIELRFGTSRPGSARLKAIFAGAARVTDPATGAIKAFYPPANPRTHDFASVQDAFFVADVVSAPILTWQLSERDAAAMSLPRTQDRVYFVLSAPGLSLADIDAQRLRLRKE